MTRFARFNAVSAMGAGVQGVTLWLLCDVAKLGVVVSAAIAVATAVVHNFLWHRAWTWADRARSRAGVMRSFWRFALSNGAVSLGGNVVAMAILVEGAGLHPIAASAVAVAVTGVANFWLGDRVVFRRRSLAP